MEIAHYLPGVTPRGGLITPTSLITKKEWAYTREFGNPSCSMSLRPFSITHDIDVITAWDWKLGRAGDMVAASYLYMRDSDFARSFMVLVNKRTPVFQIDICQAAKDELDEYYRSVPGDFIIRFLFNTSKKKIRPLHIKALQACIEYFFSFPEVKQLIAEIETGNMLYHELMIKTGFRFKERISHEYSVSNLYLISRGVFHKNLFQ